MHLYGRRRAPRAVGETRDEDARAGGGGELEANAGGREDGEADGVVEDFAGNSKDGSVAGSGPLLVLLAFVVGRYWALAFAVSSVL